jgi:hypothetical protein
MTIESLGSHVPSKFFRINELGLWAADRALIWGGVGLVAFGLAAWQPALLLGWMSLALAFFAWVSEWNGIALPRPGLVPIRGCGCWESPLAFTVRHRNRVWLFTRDDDAASGWSEAYTVRHKPNGARWELPLAPSWELLAPGNDWSLHGHVPVASLRFEHHERISYVASGSLDRALVLSPRA